MKDDITRREMVDAFISEEKDYYIGYLKEMKRKGKAMDYNDLIKMSLTCYPEHKWHIEQFGKEEAFRLAALALKSKEKKILNSRTFDELIKHINDIEIKDFGELAKYDAALAFGAAMDKLPDKIFIHAGPRTTAQFIFDKDYSTTVKYLTTRPTKIEYINVNDMPEEFAELKSLPYLIEDCLCFIYKKYLKEKN